MQTITFQEIRKLYPDDFLVLIEPEENQVSVNEVEVTGAKEVKAYKTGNEMYQVYKELKKSGVKATFCLPDYKDRFIIQQIPSMRIFGNEI